jgi:hypothetical protein
MTLYTFGGESFVPKYMYHNSVMSLKLNGETRAQGSSPALTIFLAVLGVVVIVVGGVFLASRFTKQEGSLLPTKRA